MAYQKLQAGRALAVINSNSINIPDVGGPTVTSTMSQAPPSNVTLVDNTQDFTAMTGLVGSTVIVNGTAISRVESVTNATSIVLEDAILTTSQDYVIYFEDTNGCVLYAGSGGNIRVLTTGNDDVTFVGVAPGAFIPVQVKRVFASGTGPSDIVALW